MTAVATAPAVRQFTPAAERLIDVWGDLPEARREFRDAQAAERDAAARFDGGKADAERLKDLRWQVAKLERRLSAVREVPGKLLALTDAHPPDLAAALAAATERVKEGRSELKSAMERVDLARGKRELAAATLAREEKHLHPDPKFRASLPLGHSVFDSAHQVAAAESQLAAAEDRLAEVVLSLDEAERGEQEAEAALFAWFGVDRDDLYASRNRCQPVGFISNGKPYGTTVRGRMVCFNPFTPFVCDDASEVKYLRDLCGPHKYLKEVSPNYRAPASKGGGDGRSIWDRLGLKLPDWMGGRYVPHAR